MYSGSLPHQLDGVQLDGFYGSRVLTRQYDSLKRPSGFKLGSALFSSSDLLQTYSFNSLGRFESVATTSSAQALRTFSYAYNNGGLVSGLGVVSGQFGVTYGYEPSRDLVTQVESKWGSAVRSRFDYTYNTLGQRITAKQSSDLTTGAFADFGGSTYFRYTYNDRGEVTQGVNYLGEDPVSTSSPQLVGRRFGYDYDKIGNRVSSTRSLGTGVSDLYTSCATNQYRTRENDIGYTGGTAQGSSSVTVTGGTVPSTVGRAGRHWGAEFVPANTSSPAKVDLTITATLAGAGSGGADLVRTATASTVIPPALQALKYDADGNLIDDGLWTYSYDAENRLIAMQTELTAIVAITSANARRLEFKYDYLNRRVEKRVLSGWNGSGYPTELFKRRFLYDGWNLVAEISASTSALVRTYTWALDMAGSLTATGGIAALVQITDHGTATSYLPTYDGNGNVASLVRSSDGVIAASYEYSPFGELLRCSQPASGGYAKENPFRFSTKFTDDETGLVYYGARFFDPRNGRFINRDPIEEAGGFNLYGFSGNDGVNGYDYLGYEPVSIGYAIGFLASKALDSAVFNALFRGVKNLFRKNSRPHPAPVVLGAPSDYSGVWGRWGPPGVGYDWPMRSKRSPFSMNLDDDVSAPNREGGWRISEFGKGVIIDGWLEPLIHGPGGPVFIYDGLRDTAAIFTSDRPIGEFLDQLMRPIEAIKRIPEDIQTARGQGRLVTTVVFVVISGRAAAGSEVRVVGRVGADGRLVSMSNAEVRAWYNEQLRKIDTSGPLTRETAARVHGQRNALKQASRDAMSDRAAAEQLAREKPLRPLEYYVEKYGSQGFQGEALWKRIIEGGTTPNPTINKQFGIK